MKKCLIILSWKLPYLLKPKASQYDPQPAKSSRNYPKQLQKIAKRPKTTQNFKIGEIWNFLPGFVYQIFQSFNKILAVPYLEGANFKSDIGFWKIWTQMSKFGHFGAKCINFLIF